MYHFFSAVGGAAVGDRRCRHDEELLATSTFDLRIVRLACLSRYPP